MALDNLKNFATEVTLATVVPVEKRLEIYRKWDRHDELTEEILTIWTQYSMGAGETIGGMAVGSLFLPLGLFMILDGLSRAGTQNGIIANGYEFYRGIEI